MIIGSSQNIMATKVFYDSSNLSQAIHIHEVTLHNAFSQIISYVLLWYVWRKKKQKKNRNCQTAKIQGLDILATNWTKK